MTPSTTLPALQPINLWVVCLCADWCGVCRDYRAVFEQIAAQNGQEFPASKFAWVDVEDDADQLGDLDIETFPTLLVADGDGVLFSGALTQHGGTLSRLLASLQAAGAKRTPHTAATQKLLAALPTLRSRWV